MRIEDAHGQTEALPPDIERDPSRTDTFKV
jgi:hypothetical protein